MNHLDDILFLFYTFFRISQNARKGTLMKKAFSSNKLSVLEIILFILLFLCYLGTLYFVIQNDRNLFLVFFLFFSCLSIITLLVSHAKITSFALQSTENASKKLADELQQLPDYAEEIAALKQERDQLIIDKEQSSATLSDMRSQLASLSEALSKERDMKSQAEEQNLNHLLPPKEEPIDLDIIACARKVIEEMNSYSLAAGISLLLSSANDSLMVHADASYIRILFRNIIDNSIKYMNRNGSLVITISNIGEDLFIVLKDNGEGLPLPETAHIFELNYQGSNRVSGNGLGLTQAKAIVEYYGGTIYAKSESGKGMGIYIQLPTSSR